MKLPVSFTLWCRPYGALCSMVLIMKVVKDHQVDALVVSDTDDSSSRWKPGTKKRLLWAWSRMQVEPEEWEEVAPDLGPC